jgi:hypothetical protein
VSKPVFQDLPEQGEPEFMELSGFYRFEEIGDSITGYLLGRSVSSWLDEKTGEVKDAIPQWLLLTNNGIIHINETVKLQRLLSLVPLRALVKITFKEKVKTSAGTMKDFAVQVTKASFAETAKKLLEQGLETEENLLTTNAIEGE